jgi:hypothetical protein
MVVEILQRFQWHDLGDGISLAKGRFAKQNQSLTSGFSRYRIPVFALFGPDSPTHLGLNRCNAVIRGGFAGNPDKAIAEARESRPLA